MHQLQLSRDNYPGIILPGEEISANSMETRSRRPALQVQRTVTALRKMAMEHGPGAKLPTADSLCLQLHVSRTTLNEVLNILELQNVLYRRQGSGIFVSPHLHRKSICILLSSYLFLSSNTSPFWGMLWGYFAEEAQRRSHYKDEYCSFHQVISLTPEERTLPEDVARMIATGQIHGVLAVGTSVNINDWIVSQRVPCVVYAGYTNSGCIVTWPIESQVHRAISQLVAQGCRRIGLWTGVQLDENNQPVSSMHPDILNCFTDILASFDCAYEPQFARSWYPLTPRESTPIPTMQDQGYQIAMDVFQQKTENRPDGVFILDETLAVGALTALHRLGIRIGKDIHIVSHATRGSQTLYSFRDEIQVVELDPVQLVRTMFDVLDQLMANQTPPAHITRLPV